jgi:23S rRNA (uracil1939-C5)-methyltransferase
VLTKNQEIELNILTLGSEGEGIGKTEDGMTVFVADALPGDKVLAHIVKVKKTYAYAIIAKVLAPSSFRVTPMCSVAAKCGGCNLQHLDYKKQLEFKARKVLDCIERIGGIKNPPMEEIVGADDAFYYRNKAQFPVGRNKEGRAAIGFYRKHSHDVVANTNCGIQAKINEKIMNAVEKFLNEYKIKAYDETLKEGLVRHVFTRVGFVTKEVMVCLVINGDSIKHSEELVSTLNEVIEKEGYVLKSVSLNINKKDTNVIMGEKCVPLYGDLYIEDYIGDIKYRISPLSFYQVNPAQTKKLYDLAKEYAGLSGNEVLWDLYCGIGTISLYLSKSAKKVYGVEIVPEAIADAKENAKINGIENAEFFVGASEDVADSLPKPDVIVVDPPRKGCDEKLLNTIISVAPKRLVYVSCDPATLGRDLKFLCANGYELKEVRPVDQFPNTVHVETAALLTLGDGVRGPFFGP